MTRRSYSWFTAPILAVLAAGCSSSSDQFPSLAVREAERLTGQFTPAQPGEPAPTYSVPSSQIDAALATARAAHQRFIAARPGAQASARGARGSAVGTSPHSLALIDLADLSTYHSETSIALAALDRLEAQAATLFAPTDAVKAAQAEVAALIGTQDETLESLDRELAR